MNKNQFVAFKRGNQYLALGGFQVRSLLSASLFTEATGMSAGASADTVARLCQDRWTDFAHTLSAFPEPIELLFAIFNRAPSPYPESNVAMAFFAVGRGTSRESALNACEKAAHELLVVLTTSLDYLEFEAFDNREYLNHLVKRLMHGKTIEIRRRMELLRVSHGQILRKEIGFGRQASRTRCEGVESGVELEHLFSWVPSDDSWHRLIEALDVEQQPVLFAVHVQGLERTPEACLHEARAALASAEQLAGRSTDTALEIPNILQLEAASLRGDALYRLGLLEDRTMAARVFLNGEGTPSGALVAITETVIHDASVHPGQRGTEPRLRGGARVAAVPTTDLLESLENPSYDVIFGVTEMGAILRTPMPVEIDLPGVQIHRARTAGMNGRGGDDCTLGFNFHRGKSREVSLESKARFHHTYIVGQTGTGKSTLMLNMILHDIRAGRGVGVLDPHGSLFEDILERIPDERIDDVVLLDATDVDYPVGLNILKINEPDPFEYQRARDIVIDDIYNFLDRAYTLNVTGGPIFESHFRGMLALLMGRERGTDWYVPNLMIFRSLYSNAKLREKLAKRIVGTDPVIDEFIKEAIEAKTDLSLNNVAPYITSKFSRFVNDVALRNITCQNSMLDLDDIVNNGKILLLNFGKGRFGELATGLLASQVVSRIRLAAMRRGAHPDAKPFYLYADEFHLFADERFTELLAEARKFRLSLTVAHQFMKQLPEKVLGAVLGNVGTVVALRVSGNDGALLEPVFKPTFSHRDIASLANYQAYVRTLGAPGNTPFSMTLLPPPPAGSSKRSAVIRALSRKRHARTREFVEYEIMQNYRAYTQEQPVPPPLPTKDGKPDPKLDELIHRLKMSEDD